MLTYQKLKWFTILLAPLIIGSFEILRHGFLLKYISMEVGNYYTALLTFVLSYVYASWMFNKIKSMNQKLSEEKATRAVYEERERLASELHDNIAQTLFFLNVKLKQGNLKEAHSAVCDIDHHVRQAIFNLRPLSPGNTVLTQRLTKWLNEWSTLSNIEVISNIDMPVFYFSPSEEVQLFGIIQEAFANVRKHANAKQVNISLTSLPEGFRLWIADDGKGLEVDLNHSKKYGLAIMQERAEQLGASFNMYNREKGGLEIILLKNKLVKPFFGQRK